MSEHHITVILPVRDLPPKEIAKPLPPAVPETKAKVSRFFLNAMTKKTMQKKIVRSVNGFEELRQAITIAINTIPAIRSRGQYFEDAVIAQLEESLKKAGC